MALTGVAGWDSTLAKGKVDAGIKKDLGGPLIWLPDFLTKTPEKAFNSARAALAIQSNYKAGVVKLAEAFPIGSVNSGCPDPDDEFGQLLRTELLMAACGEAIKPSYGSRADSAIAITVDIDFAAPGLHDRLTEAAASARGQGTKYVASIAARLEKDLGSPDEMALAFSHHIIRPGQSWINRVEPPTSAHNAGHKSENHHRG